MSKYIVLTGATGGLGEELVKLLAKKGNYLLLLARNKAKLENIASTYSVFCDGIDYYICDFEKQQYDDIISWINGRMDTIIYNAGYGLFLEAQQFQNSDIINMFNVNVLTPLHLTTKLLSILYNQGKGNIVFIASQASKLVTPKSSVYSSTKFALRGYANGIRVEAKQYGVHVMVVNTGPVNTNFFDTADKTGKYKHSVSNIMLSSAVVAKAIVKGIEKRKREINLPWWMELISKLSVLFPKTFDKMITLFGNKK